MPGPVYLKLVSRAIPSRIVNEKKEQADLPPELKPTRIRMHLFLDENTGAVSESPRNNNFPFAQIGKAFAEAVLEMENT